MSPDGRSSKGVFLAFQYPVEIPSVATMTFLRTALNAPDPGPPRAEATNVTQVESFIAAEGSRYGDTATCRMSFARYNTKDGVDTLAESMVKAQEFFA